MNFHDQKQLDTLSEDFCSLLTIEEFSGTLDWQNALDFLVSNFPGSFGAILIQRRQQPNSAVTWTGDIDPDAITSFSSHYAQINPWVDIWKGLPNGSVRVSENHSPARQFRGMEFYEDWIRPRKNAEAAVGIKLCDSTDFLLHMPIHFNLNQCELYNDALAYVLTYARRAFMRAIRTERLFSAAYRAGSMDQFCNSNEDPIFVIDVIGRVQHSNPGARRLVYKKVVMISRGTLTLNHRTANNWLETQMARAKANSRVYDWRSVFRIGNQLMLIELIPINISSPSRIFGAERHFALKISNPISDTWPDIEVIALLYGLTPSEMRLCSLISKGFSVQEAAKRLGNTESTARSTLKIIFDKTQTNRQGELIALCHRFPAARVQ